MNLPPASFLPDEHVALKNYWLIGERHDLVSFPLE